MKRMIVGDGQQPIEEPMSAADIEAIPRIELKPRRTCTPLEFLERFAQEERIAIRRAARAQEALEDWLDMLRAVQEVDLDDPRTQAGVQAMVQARLITPERAAEVLA